MFRLIREGVSWSGNERNNLFLNTSGNGGFCDISSATGFDFPDDGRGMVLLDWDADGDLDSITSNRNAPQLRFLRNDVPNAGNQSLGIRLIGTAPNTNRDAIGARVTVALPNQPPLIRTLRAGEGFQAQNSKWLHFGLGEVTEILSVTVSWPSGSEETFSGIHPGGRYQLTQGQGAAVPVPDRAVNWPDLIPELEVPESESGGRASTGSRLPLTELPYVTLDGKAATLEPSTDGQPMLINLWASWCLPCLKELKEFSEHQDELESSGLQIFALSLDGVNGQPGTPKAAQGFMNSLDKPFETGVATPEALEKITILHDLVFETRGSISLPTSLLIDGQGRLAGFYEGPLKVENLKKHLRSIGSRGESLDLSAALPFSGRWLAEPAGFRLSEYGDKLIKLGYHKDAGFLVEKYPRAFQVDPALPGFLARLGLAFEKQGDLSAAVRYYEISMKLKPGEAIAYQKLGTKQIALGRFPGAEASFRSALAIDNKSPDTHYNLGIALNKQRKSEEALAEFMKVVKLAPRHALAHANIAAQMMQRRDLPTAIKHLGLARDAKPDFHAVRFQLGRLLEAVGKPQEAIKEYESLLALEPKHRPAAERLKSLRKKSP